MDLALYGEVLSREGPTIKLRVPRAETSRATARLLADVPVTDLTIEEAAIEDVIERVFATGTVARRTPPGGTGGAPGGRECVMRALLDLYWTHMKAAIQVQFQYRWEFRVQRGQLLARLLKPVFPLHYDLS